MLLDHLGLVGSTIDKLGITNEIDKRMPMTKEAKTTYGQRVTAMILNGLGFMDDRLYLNGYTDYFMECMCLK